MFVCKDQEALVELTMMAGNPTWWSMDSNIRSSSTTDHHHHRNNHHQEVAPNFLMISQTHPNNFLSLPTVQYLHGSSSSSASSPTSNCSPLHFSSLLLANEHEHDHHHPPHDFPHSWSQLLLRGLGSEHQQEERFGASLFQPTRVMSNNGMVDVKEEVSSQNNNNLYGYRHEHEEQETTGISSSKAPPVATGCWSHSSLPASSPKSCITSLSSTSNSILDFSTTKTSLHTESHSNSECNSTASGAAPNKKPRAQSSSNPPLKVRKEKLGDRITALHQLVSPFGKTDTASVLLEAIGYIRFLQGQIEALSSPYLGGNDSSAKHPHDVHGNRSSLFPGHPGQEKRNAAKDLKSRGLCLVPISCTQLVGSDNGADYWAPSLGGGF